MHKNVTIMITTKNRNLILLETLDYYDQRFFGNILIVDSSNKKDHDLLRKRDYSFKLDLFHDEKDLPQQKLFEEYSNFIKTEYTLWSGDDDFYMCGMIEELSNKLDVNEKYSLASGYSVAVYRENKDGIIVDTEPYVLPIIDKDKPFDRFNSLTDSFSPGLFFLCRTSLWAKMVSSIEYVEDKAYATEYFPTFVGILSSQVLFVEKLWMIRMIHPQRFSLIKPNEFTVNDLNKVQESKLKLVEKLMSINIDGLSAGYIYGRLSLCFDEHRYGFEYQVEQYFRYSRLGKIPIINKMLSDSGDFKDLYNHLNKSKKNRRLLVIWGNQWIFDAFIEEFIKIKNEQTDIVLLYNGDSSVFNEVFFNTYVGVNKLFKDAVSFTHNFEPYNISKVEAIIASLKVFDPTDILSLSNVYPFESVVINSLPGARTILLWPHVSNIYHNKLLSSYLLNNGTSKYFAKLFSIPQYIKMRRKDFMQSLSPLFILIVSVFFIKFIFGDKIKDIDVIYKGVKIIRKAAASIATVIPGGYRRLISLLVVREILRASYHIGSKYSKFSDYDFLSLSILSKRTESYAKSTKILKNHDIDAFSRLLISVGMYKYPGKVSRLILDKCYGIKYSDGLLSYSTKISPYSPHKLIVFSREQKKIYKNLFPGTDIIECDYPASNKITQKQENKRVFLFAPSISVEKLNRQELMRVIDDIARIIKIENCDVFKVKFHSRGNQKSHDYIIKLMRDVMEYDIDIVDPKLSFYELLSEVDVVFCQISGVIIESLPKNISIYCSELLSKVDYFSVEKVAREIGGLIYVDDKGSFHDYRDQNYRTNVSLSDVLS